MKIKRISKIALTTIIAVAPVAAAVSCGDEKKETLLPVSNNWASVWKTASKSLYFEAKITHWIDGDTARFQPIDQHGTDIANGHSSLRIQNLDSPEVPHDFPGSSPVSDIEKKWGYAATDLAKQLIPEGTTVRIWTNGSPSYNRITGNIFFGENYAKNYGLEQLRAGLSLPMINIHSITDRNNVNHFLMQDLVNAFNNAFVNKRGLHSMTPKQLASTISVHGVTVFDDLLYSRKDKPGNVYRLIEAIRKREHHG